MTGVNRLGHIPPLGRAFAWLSAWTVVLGVESPDEHFTRVRSISTAVRTYRTCAKRGALHPPCHVSASDEKQTDRAARRERVATIGGIGAPAPYIAVDASTTNALCRNLGGDGFCARACSRGRPGRPGRLGRHRRRRLGHPRVVVIACPGRAGCACARPAQRRTGQCAGRSQPARDHQRHHRWRYARGGRAGIYVRRVDEQLGLVQPASPETPSGSRST